MTDLSETMPPPSAASAAPAAEPRAPWRPSTGLLCALPMLLLLGLGFLAPLLIVAVYSFMPRGTFSLTGAPTFENYVDIVAQNFHISFLWSIWLALLTTVILMAVCWPLAVSIKRVSPSKALLLTVLIVAPLFVAENIRLQGWSLFLDRAGLLDGALRSTVGLSTGSLTANVPAVVFGMAYIYLPFMLFPMMLGLSNVPPAAVEAAQDLGASRWQQFRDIELPLAAPGLVIGALLVFVISLGAFSESKFLGKGVIVTVSEDIESAFTFGQNWPRGSALSVLVIVLAGAAAFVGLRRLDLDSMLGRK
ncbi:ABC transporter permease [uncultured Albimonas sp.]|uniref:ABC transporter permease n=1 Tax=uncultured Albimonas sp. TaxID=1331701 RepID=UPI0030EC5D02|tara:strand:- start:10007 stop:10924 length:918 start_codon:yes stop_codon:yes gene_type:complete